MLIQLVQVGKKRVKSAYNKFYASLFSYSLLDVPTPHQNLPHYLIELGKPVFEMRCFNMGIAKYLVPRQTGTVEHFFWAPLFSSVYFDIAKM